MSGILSIFIYLILIGCGVALVFYVIRAIPIPEPLGRIIGVVAMVVGIILVIWLVLGLVGGNPGLPKLP